MTVRVYVARVYVECLPQPVEPETLLWRVGDHSDKFCIILR